ncbi:MAG: DUF1674 domain-containing protein [Rhodospirillales bacterium]|nr:DUF1674 domain-containing protein [Rhodospirillales bacterium]MCB9973678.1 DUF1674 domain-containing protein [Rhodospirillales bacterium]
MSDKKTSDEKNESKKDMPAEYGGFEKRPEPTRYGDWDANGRCSDF